MKAGGTLNFRFHLILFLSVDCFLNALETAVKLFINVQLYESGLLYKLVAAG